jgi:Na+-translocating ferredoxin:NAD+ oxidoreductase RnfG subunit
MNLKRILLLLIVFFGVMTVFSQNDIDYQHRSLMRTLKKAGLNNESDIKEYKLSDTSSVKKTFSGKYFQITEDEVNPYKYIYVGRVNSCRGGGCSISANTSQANSSEYFDYFILFDSKLSVQLVKVFNYQATHGYEVTAKGWLKQFIGHDGSKPLQVNQNVDAISGATVSVNAITRDVAKKTEILQHIMDR